MKPLLFIPGFPSSTLRQLSSGREIYPPTIGEVLSDERKRALIRLLVGPDAPPGDIVAGEPIRDILLFNTLAQSLYDLLEKVYGYDTEGGRDFVALCWDWRRAVDDDPQDGDGNPLPAGRATVEIGNRPSVLLDNSRAEIPLSREILHPNVGADLCRFEVTVSWRAQGSRKSQVVPFLIHTS